MIKKIDLGGSSSAEEFLERALLPAHTCHEAKLLLTLSDKYPENPIEDFTVLKFAVDGVIPVLCICCGIGFLDETREEQVKSLARMHHCRVYLAVETIYRGKDLLLLFYSDEDKSKWQEEQEKLNSGRAEVMAVGEHMQMLSIDDLEGFFQKVAEDYAAYQQE